MQKNISARKLFTSPLYWLPWQVTKCKVQSTPYSYSIIVFYYHRPRSRLYPNLVGGYKVAEMRMHNFILRTTYSVQIKSPIQFSAVGAYYPDCQCKNT